MQYRYVSERANYEDLSSGRVLYYQRGTTAFPARLASEVFQWCQAYLVRNRSVGPYTVYDPCCGGAYLLTTLGFLHRPNIRRLAASDVDCEVLPLAQDNLGLLSSEGIRKRILQIEGLYIEYAKETHALALESARRLELQVAGDSQPLALVCFEADATDPSAVAAGVSGVDIVITDIPYGNMVRWHGSECADADGTDGDAVWRLLENVRSVLNPISVVAVVAQKGTRIQHDSYESVKRFSIGKRQVQLLRPRVLSGSH